MKKLTLLLTACAITMMSFAAGGNITYVLNGGVTNDYGWTNKSDMFDAFMKEANPTFAWNTLEYYKQQADPLSAPNIASGLTSCAILNSNAAQWGWLKTYIIDVTDTQIPTAPPTRLPTKLNSTDDGTSAAWRYAVGAFFVEGQRTGWPISADFSVAGQLDAFIPAWGHAFAGPATYDGTEEVFIPDPYKEGETFGGWFRNVDFSGGKVTSIPAGTEGNITLYAFFGEYIPTIAEVKELAAGAETKVSGVVTYANGNEVYIQDATGGLKVDVESGSFSIGDKITVSGTTVTAGAYVVLTGATFQKKEAASLPTIQSLTLSTLKADAAPYMFKYIGIDGLTIQSYGSGDVTLRDNNSNTIVLVSALNQSTLPVGTKVNVKGVVSSNEGVTYLVTDAIRVTASPVPRVDPATYEAKEDGKYTLTSKWLVSSIMDNLAANQIHSASQMVRGMVPIDGKMYFIDSNLEQLTVVDGANGNRLAPIKLEAKIFETCERPVSGSYPLNDLKLDGAGNLLLWNGVTSNKKPAQVWKINLADGTGTEVISEALVDNPDFAEAAIRFDAFGVYGDVTKDAIIMAANASGMSAFKWEIKDGVAGAAEVVIIDVSEQGTFLTGLTNPGTAPQIFPMDENYFYLDGNATLPTLIDMDGNIVDGFYNVPKEVEDWSVAHGNKSGHNGLVEFEVAGEHFFLIASGNTLATPPSSFRLFKWKDANKEFKDIESLWTLPAAGMGAVSNPYRTAVPSVEIDEANGIATLYLYTGENGYGAYEFKINVTDGVARVNNNTIKIAVNEKTLSFEEPMASVTVYSVSGQLQVKATHVNSVKVANQGVYLVKVKTIDGVNEIHKVIVK